MNWNTNQWDTLRTKIADPAFAGMSDQDTADAINAETVDVADSTQYTYREYMRRYGSDTGMMASLKAVDPELYAVLLDFGGDGGLDFSSAGMRAGLGTMFAGGALLQDQHDNWMALGVKTISWTQAVGLSSIQSKHVTWLRGGLR